MDLIEHFEAERPRLLSLAHRMLGSRQDAEDVVQTVWTRTQGVDGIDNPGGWFTTVTARLCADRLRAWRRRPELPLLEVDFESAELAAEEEFLRREQVSRALLVLLDALSPRQRVAYVLHDLFALPFEQVAEVLAVRPDAAKKLASRARTAVRAVHPGSVPAAGGARAVTEAFLAAAGGGDLARLVALLAPDAVRRADPRLLPPGTPAEVRGAEAIAAETRRFAARIALATALATPTPTAVIAPAGRPYALVRLELDARGLITRVTIEPLARLPLAAFAR
ncbi:MULTISPECIES: sigma-70 family RNA polymerase sigma factor [Kitasatospora]|uniref:Putative RNA polymerase ECF subfamily sigma factor n=1 Tax=Kitasatospora setae (strain ATCC 33774 / DSM 43861 / JCM 3304 / KCC A-0304 / NBRC 14216 / KM-6054) TaxID=452652 RepID=E4N6N0_KITSK|nr:MULTISPECIES: sigma-70 family RNA polymerase sigma factor [Kitasatospora]BAJ26861.1 putative RNA polymerase ECF subfamily sigma factor [Kitasatospora setae KM-6054]